MKTATLDEIKAMKAAGQLTTPSDKAKAEDLPEGFWDDAKVVHPAE